MDVWRVGGMRGCKDRWMNRWWDGWMEGRREGWMNRRMDGKTYGWEDVRMCAWLGGFQ